MNNIMTTILGSVGGTTVVIAGLSTWLGNVWAKRILEKDRMKYQKELELIKMEYEVHFDGLKAILLRYSERQFDIYKELWGSLCELKLSADNLWLRAIPENVTLFSDQLNKTRFWLEKSSLFIEDEHYNRLKSVFDEFEQFLVGKENLIELRKMPNVSDEELHNRTRNIVNRNHWHRDNYIQTLSELRNYFKQHIRGSNKNAHVE